MAALFRDVRAYFSALFHNWMALMAGSLAVVAWAVGAALEPMPVPMRWSFLACGVAAILLAGFLVWRGERRGRLSESVRLKLTILADEGERALALYTASVEGRDYKIGAALDGIARMRQECERIIKAECPHLWQHFDGLGQPDGRGMAEGTQLFLQRLRTVLGALERGG